MADEVEVKKPEKAKRKTKKKKEEKTPLTDEDTLKTTAVDDILKSVMKTSEISSTGKKKKKKEKDKEDRMLEALRSGEVLAKDEDKRLLANTYDPELSPKSEKSNKQRERIKNIGIDNEGYEKDKADIIDETAKPKRAKKKKDKKPETEETKDSPKEKSEPESTPQKPEDAPNQSEDASPKKKKKKKKTEDAEKQEEKPAEEIVSPSENELSPRKEKKKKKKKVSEDVEKGGEQEDEAKKVETETAAGDETKEEGDIQKADAPAEDEKVKKKKKKKKKETEAEEVKSDAEVEQEPVEDEGRILGMQIHRTDKLKNDFYILHPLIRVHIIDENTGYYVKKQHKERPVSSYYEVENECVSHILPILTQPFDFKQRKSQLPVWEELLLFNENYNYFYKGNHQIIVFFEVLDFVSMNTAGVQYETRRNEGGWHRIAWAFLKIVGANQKLNIGHKVRLQLFNPPTRFRLIKGQVEVYQWWKSQCRDPYPSTLYVTLKGLSPPENVEPALRSMFANQKEVGSTTYDEWHSATIKPTHEATKRALSSWTRLAGQVCRIPNTMSLILAAGREGCYVLKFSHDGRNLACACRDKEGFPIYIYEVPSGDLKGLFVGHFAIVYDLSWSKQDTHLLSCSSDGTARVWNVLNLLEKKGHEEEAEKLLPHPSFVYSSQYHPRVDSIVVTAGYDQVVRIWDVQTEDPHGQLMQEIVGHQGHINSMCFEPDGKKLYTADSTGCIHIWNVFVSELTSRRAFERDWTEYEKLLDPDIKGTIINHIKLHPNGRRLMIHCRDNVIRMMDLRVHRIMQKYIGALNFREQIRSTVSPCGSFVFSGSEDNNAYAWNTETGDQVAMYSELNYLAPVTDVDFHPREHMIALCSMGTNQPVIIYKYDPHISQMEAGFHSRSPSPTLEATDEEEAETLRQTDTSGPRTMVMTKDEFQSVEKQRFAKAMKKLNSVSMLSSTGSHPLGIPDQSLMRSHFGTSFGTTLNRTYDATNPRTMAMSHTAFSPHASHTLSSTMQQQSFTQQNLYMKNADEGWRPGFSQVGKYGGRSSSPSFYGRPPQLSMTASQGKAQFSFQHPPGKAVPKVQKVVALYDYKAQRSDELCIFKGDIITVLYKDNENWWMGELSDGQQGFFPSHYVAEEDNLDDDQRQQLMSDSDGGPRRKHGVVKTKGGDLRIFSGTDSDEELISARPRRRKGDTKKKVQIDTTLNSSNA